MLVYHNLDVAAVGAVLLDWHPALLHRLTHMMGLDEARARPWLLWLLAHHDIGKFAAAFQRLKPELCPEPIPDRYRYTERHDTLGYVLWKDRLFEEIFPWVEAYSPVEDALFALLRTSSGHHGKPPLEIQWRSTWFREEDIAAVRHFSGRISELFFHDEIPPGICPDDKQDFSGRVVLASWALAGLAVLSDWIGSNENWFPFVRKPMGLESYWESFAIPRAERALDKAALLPSPPAEDTAFSKLFPGISRPTALQEAADAVLIEDGPQLFVIEDLAGSGKTEAALALAGRLLTAGKAEGIYVALPTTATADAMYSRVGGAYLRMFQASNRPSLVLAHSRRDLSTQFRKSVLAEDIKAEEAYGNGERGGSATCAAWLADNRKKSLLAQVGVGTIDQVLLAVLRVRHQSLRTFGLLGKVLIIDEVHACDAYMNRLLVHLLHLHAAQGGSAILLSATLPKRARQELVVSFAAGAGFDLPTSLPDSYPQLLAVSEHGTRQKDAEAPPWSQRALRFQLLYDPQAATGWVAQRAKDGCCVCWIRNTVDDAIQASEILADKLGTDFVTLFHARFALGDRLAIEEDVLERFGKQSTADSRRGHVVVATQVIEQSLDLDFDEMLSDLAPIDLLLQRAGRLHRHPRDQQGNPLDGDRDSRGDPVLHVLTPDPVKEPGAAWIRSFLPGTAAVYPHHGQLWRTARFLHLTPTLMLPDQLRHAIEIVFSETSELAIPEDLERASFCIEGEWRADASVAELNGINLELGYGGGWGNWTDQEDTRTRLGEPTVTLRLARWDGEKLMPWYQGMWRPWALSELRVRRSRVAKLERPTAPALVEAVESLEKRDRLLDFGKILLPLEETGDGAWACSVFNIKKQSRCIRYRSDRGLEVGK